MVVYLPISFIKDWLYSLIRSGPELSRKSSGILDSPLNYVEMQNNLEMELQSSLSRKDSDLDISSEEEGLPFIARSKDDFTQVREKKVFSSREIAKYGLYLAPIWFMTEVRVPTILLCAAHVFNSCDFSTFFAFCLFLSHCLSLCLSASLPLLCISLCSPLLLTTSLSFTLYSSPLCFSLLSLPICLSLSPLHHSTAFSLFLSIFSPALMSLPPFAAFVCMEVQYC